MNVKQFEAIFKPEAHPRLIKTAFASDEQVGIILLEEMYDDENQRFDEGYYVFARLHDRLVSIVRYDALEDASEAFNKIITMFRA